MGGLLGPDSAAQGSGQQGGQQGEGETSSSEEPSTGHASGSSQGAKPRESPTAGREQRGKRVIEDISIRVSGQAIPHVRYI